MGDYVSVDPSRLRQLAAALKDAAALVPDKKSTITSAISGWDGSWDATKLTTLATWLEGQWRAMEDRADLAATAAHQAVITTPDDPHAHWRGIPWDITPEVLATEGLQDAINIRSHLASGDEEAVERAQAELAAALTAHADDPAWMQTFLSNGGGQVIDTANRGVLGDHIPISEEGQAQLSSYANGVAAATLMFEGGEISIPADAFAALYDQDSVMATGVMMKFGPPGDRYGAQFLADATDAALEWREHHPPRPGYSEGQVVGTGYVPGGYVQDDDDWWTRYGVNVSYLTVGRDDAAERIQLIRDYDPVLSILGVTAENTRASQLVLTGPEGAEHAQALVQYDWATPPGMDDSGPAGALIRSATQDRSAEFAQASAEAAANVFEAAHELWTDDPRNDYTRELYPQLPASLAQSLSAMAQTYLVDLARSTSNPDSDVNGVTRDSILGTWVVQTNTTVMNSFLQLFMTDPAAAGSFQGAVNAQLSNAATATARWPDDQTVTDLLRQTGYLNGMTAIVISDQGFTEAEAQDAANKREQTYVDATLGVIGAIPGMPDSVSFVNGLASTFTGAGGDALFPQDAASTFTEEAQFIHNTNIADMRLYVAQGYATAGVYVPPADASFMHDGVIAPATEQEQLDFDNWYANMPNHLADLNDAPEGYGDAAAVYAPNDSQFDEPK